MRIGKSSAFWSFFYILQVATTQKLQRFTVNRCVVICGYSAVLPFGILWNFTDLITLVKIVFNLRKSVWSSDFSPYKTTKHKSMSPQFVPSPLVGLWPLRSWCPEEYHHHRKRLIIILENPFFHFQLYYYTFILFKPLYVVFSSAQTLQLVTYYTTLIFIALQSL